MTQKECTRQESRLLPDPDVTHVVLYCLAYFVAKFEMLLHEFSYTTDRELLEITDGKATRPQFLAALHSLVTRAINRKYGERDALWSSRRYLAPVLHDEESRIDHAVGILTKVVEAGLVGHAWSWPGATSYEMEYGEPVKIKRPAFFFSTDMPDEVELVIRRPPDTRPDLDDRALRELIRQRVRERQRKIALGMSIDKRTFLGKAGVSSLPRDSVPRHQTVGEIVDPLVGTRNAKRRLAALHRNQRFMHQHQTARASRTAGDTNAVFPFGTYLARVRDGAPCHGSDP